MPIIRQPINLYCMVANASAKPTFTDVQIVSITDSYISLDCLKPIRSEELYKYVDGILLCVNQDGDQNRDFSIDFNADQTNFQGDHVQLLLLALSHRGGMNGQVNDLFRQTKTVVLADFFPSGARRVGTNICIRAKDQIEMPPGQITSIE